MIISSGVTGLKDKKGKKIAFYQSMENTGIDRIKDVSPSTLHFISYLEKCGHEVKYSIIQHDLEKQLSYFNPDVVALSGCSPDMDAIFNRAKEIKASYPDIAVVVGGYMANNIGDLLIHCPDIDAVFEGESEYSFPLFLKNLQTEKISRDLENIALGKSPITHNSARKIISSSFTRMINGEKIIVPINNVFIKDSNGMIYFNNEKNRTGTKTDIAPIQGELDDILDIPWWGIYAENSPGLSFDFFGSSRSVLQWQGVGIYARRGCSGKCSFCSIKCGLRTPSVDSVVDRINSTITKYSHQTPKRKASSIHFTDDSFTQDKEWCKSLLKKLRETRLSSRLEMSMQHRVDDLYIGDRLDTEALDLLAENNFRQNIGVESMSPKTIENMKKSSDGAKYIKQAEELIIESLKRRIPTKVFAITISPSSTPRTIAEDYLNWSRLAKKCYEETGRVFHLSANVEQSPAHTNQITQKLIGYKDCQMGYQPFKEKTDLDDIYVSGTWHPFLEGKNGLYLGVFNPRNFIFNKETKKILDLLRKVTAPMLGQENPIQYHTDYIYYVGNALMDYAKAENKADLFAVGEEIIANMTPVLLDSDGYRRKLKDEAKERFSNVFYKGSLSFGHDGKHIDFNIDNKNLYRRLKGEPVKMNRLEEVMDEIVNKNPQSYEQLKKIIIGRTIGAYFQQVMSGIYKSIREHQCDLYKDDSDDRQDAGRQAVNELLISGSILDRTEREFNSGIPKFLGDSLETNHMRDTIKWYPEKAEHVRDLIKNGVRFNPPSGMCIQYKDGYVEYV